VVDFGTFNDEDGNRQFKFIVIDSSRDIFNPKTKYYQNTKLYKILGLTKDGIYYEAEIPQRFYTDFDLDYPENSKKQIITLYYPSWTNEINFIPVVAINALDNTLKFGPSFIQDLINLILNQSLETPEQTQKKAFLKMINYHYSNLKTL
jgi:hypothetical protein